MRIKKKKAFSLVEVITTLVFISLLILLFSFLSPSIFAKVRDAKRKTDIRKIATLINEFYEKNNCYPQAIPLCGNPFKIGDFVILSQIPCDPKSKNSYVYVPEPKDCPSWFQIYGNLENKKDPVIKKIGCENGCGPDCLFNFGISSPNQKLDKFCTSFLAQEEQETIDNFQQNLNEGSKDQEILQYVCTPAGKCEVFKDPERSGCPDVYINDPTCQDACKDKNNRCHDERGKIK